VSLVVSDTTPLNYLILIGHIDVLPRLFGELLVPPAVIHEMQHPKAPSAVSAWAANLPPWIEVKAPLTDLHLGIGAGEDEAISLAVELGDATLLADDVRARSAAKSRGLLTIGTLAILDRADEAKVLDFEAAILRLQATSFHLDDALLQTLLARVRARNSA
jgi:predicted nucleic acid-binding protein